MVEPAKEENKNLDHLTQKIVEADPEVKGELERLLAGMYIFL